MHAAIMRKVHAWKELMVTPVGTHCWTGHFSIPPCRPRFVDPHRRAVEMVVVKAYRGGKCACCFCSHHFVFQAFGALSALPLYNPFYSISGWLGSENKLRSWLNFLQQVETPAARCLAFSSWRLPGPAISSLCRWQCRRIVLLLYLYKGVMD